MNRSPSQPSSDVPRSARPAATQRKTVLRALRGEEQLKLLDLDFTAPREKLLSHALSLVVESLSVDAAHGLTLTKRHALVRAAMIQDGVSVIETAALCDGCHGKLELSLDLRSVVTPEPPSSGTVRAGRRRIRLPRPADLEAVTTDADLLKRLGAGRDRDAGEQALAEADPLAEIEITGSCSECGQPVSSSYDLAATWLARLRDHAAELLEEVHFLASWYHWSEREILEVPGPRRRAYIDLCRQLEDEMGEMYAR